MRIEIEKVSLSLGGRRIYDELSATLNSPGIVCLMGPSGSGKTTFLGLIAGYVSPDQGQVLVDGNPPTSESDVDWIVQSSPLLTRRTALDNVRLGPLSRGVQRASATEASLLAMETLGIDHLGKSIVHQLSGGERQRVAVARSIATGPRLLLADEPTASLDQESRRAVCDSLEAAAAEGALVIVATHDPYVASRCERTFAVSNGKLAPV